MGTTQPHYSESLCLEVEEAGGNYIECPVSGSKRQAESRELVAMMAGKATLFPSITPLIKAMCKTVVPCGNIPGALNMKIAVNLYLLNMVTGLAEAYHFAEEKQLDTEKFVQVLNASPMASAVSKIKLDKLLTRDFSKQASIIDVLAVANLIKEGLDETELDSPLARTSHALYQEAVDMGYGEIDMIGIIELLRARHLKTGNHWPKSKRNRK
jgi:3-hydroxyisobutyrate dehydrogenase